MTCKKCGKEFKSEAALKDHLRDAQVHRETAYPHKSPYRIWVLAIFVLVVICGVAILAYTGTQSGTRGTTQTVSTPTPSGGSNIVWTNHLFNLSEGGMINATLNPVGRLNYKAQGHVTLAACQVLSNETCPTLGMWIVNQTESAILQNPNAPPPSAYALVRMSPIPGDPTEFALHNPDYNGQYYFVFISSHQGHPLFDGEHVLISISLNETWTET